MSNYIKAESVTWSYDGSTTLPKNVPEGSYVSPEKFKSSISYADGTTGESEAEYAEVAWAGNTASVTLLVGNTTYVYEFEGSGEDGSVDGDDESTEEYEDQSIPAEVEPLDESTTELKITHRRYKPTRSHRCNKGLPEYTLEGVFLTCTP